jgi:flagellar biosynthetic protein FliQ
MTLSFIPKLLAMCGVLVLMGPWLLGLMTDYIRQLIGQIPLLVS